MSNETSQPASGKSPLSADEVRRIARLARLNPTEEQVERYRRELSDVLAWASALEEVDAEGLRPMAAPADAESHPHVRLDPDVPGPMLDRSVIDEIGPSVDGGFFVVPKVFGDGGA